MTHLTLVGALYYFYLPDREFMHECPMKVRFYFGRTSLLIVVVVIHGLYGLVHRSSDDVQSV